MYTHAEVLPASRNYFAHQAILKPAVHAGTGDPSSNQLKGFWTDDLRTKGVERADKGSFKRLLYAELPEALWGDPAAHRPATIAEPWHAAGIPVETHVRASVWPRTSANLYVSLLHAHLTPCIAL